jgi:hypothetical protein
MEKTDQSLAITGPLPNETTPEIDFRETSFFSNIPGKSPELPTPDELRGRLQPGRSTIIKFEHLNLLVKFGDPAHVRLAEAQTIRIVGQACRDTEVLVPELFGWRASNGLHFIYMSLIQGSTLRECWSSLSHAEKSTISRQLGRVVAALRQIKQDLSDPFISKLQVVIYLKYIHAD